MLTFGRLERRHMEAAGQVASRAFAGTEALCQVLEVTPDQVLPFMAAVARCSVEDGVGIAAMDGDTLAGCILSTPVDADLKSSVPDVLAPTFALFEALTADVDLSGIPLERTIDMAVLAVEPAYQDKRVGREICSHYLKTIVQVGYTDGIAIATSPHTQLIIERMPAFRILRSIDVGTFVWNGTRPFAGLPGYLVKFYHIPLPGVPDR